MGSQDDFTWIDQTCSVCGDTYTVFDIREGGDPPVFDSHGVCGPVCMLDHCLGLATLYDDDLDGRTRRRATHALGLIRDEFRRAKHLDEQVASHADMINEMSKAMTAQNMRGAVTSAKIDALVDCEFVVMIQRNRKGYLTCTSRSFFLKTGILFGACFAWLFKSERCGLGQTVITSLEDLAEGGKP